jgi:hypothetical protein
MSEAWNSEHDNVSSIDGIMNVGGQVVRRVRARQLTY